MRIGRQKARDTFPAPQLESLVLLVSVLLIVGSVVMGHGHSDVSMMKGPAVSLRAPAAADCPPPTPLPQMSPYVTPMSSSSYSSSWPPELDRFEWPLSVWGGFPSPILGAPALGDSEWCVFVCDSPPRMDCCPYKMQIPRVLQGAHRVK